MEEILHQLIGSLSHYFQGFIHPRWCRISSINSTDWVFSVCRLYPWEDPDAQKTVHDFAFANRHQIVKQANVAEGVEHD